MSRVESSWISRENLDCIRNNINENIYNWLVLSNNLTESIKKTGADFKLNLLSQSVGKPYSDEALVFNKSNVDASTALVRRVFLEGNNRPMIFARVIVPESTYLNYRSEFTNLGSKPIGNTLLYNDEKVSRRDFEYNVIDSNSSVFHELKGLNQMLNEDHFWARRSVFDFPKGPILISEVFLKDIPLYPY